MRKTRSDAYRESDSDGEMMRVLGIGGLHHSEAFKQREFPDLSPRAYRICQGFDSAAALVSEEGVVAAAAEERFTYKKGTGAFPVNAIAYCLRAGSLGPADVDYVAHGFSYGPCESFFDHDTYLRKLYDEVYAPKNQLTCLQEHFPDVDWT